MLHARCLVFAWTVGAPVHILIALLTRVTIRTVTCVVLHVVMASSAVLTGRAVTFVDTVLAIRACVASLANACIVVDTVDTRAAVHATAVGAIFVVGLTINAREAELTLTGVGVDVFLANGTVLTGLRQAFVNVDLTMLAAEAVHAETRIITDAV